MKVRALITELLKFDMQAQVQIEGSDNIEFNWKGEEDESQWVDISRVKKAEQESEG